MTSTSQDAVARQIGDDESSILWREPLLPLHSHQVTSDVGARLPRQTLRETRADLLEAAVRIVNEYVRTDLPRDGDPPVDLLPFVRLEEVLAVATELARLRLVDEGRLKESERVAPLTGGAFYKAFTDGDRDGGRGAALTSFHRLVTRKMIDDDLVTGADLYVALGEQLAAEGHPWTEVARLGVQAEYSRWTATPALVLFSALALHTRDKDVQAWTSELDNEQLEALSRMYNVLLKLYGLKLRPGITVEHIAVAVSDLITGFAVNSRFGPEKRNAVVEVDVDGRGKRDWHLCALAAWGIYNSFLEPDVRS